MRIVDGRQYRFFDINNISSNDEDGSLIVEGYATTFDDAYDMGFGWSEKIDRNALEGADLSDVVLRYDHEGPVYARTRNGTLSLLADDHGLYVRANLSKASCGSDMYKDIQNGIYDRMSWAFMVDPQDGWEYDRETKTSIVKRISKVYDVSVVSIPANDGTEIKARSYLDGVIEADRRESSVRRKKAEAAAAAARMRLCGLE